MDATKRGLKTNFTGVDIAYFLGLPGYLPGMRYNNMKKHHKGNIIAYFSSIDDGTRKALTYKLASQIYEARDCRFNQDETAKLLDTTKEIIDYTLKHKKEISPKIVKGLQRIYDKTVRKPYVTKEMRKKLEKEDKR